MTANQAKAIALRAVRRRPKDVSDFVGNYLEQIIRSVVYMASYQVEYLIDDRLADAGYGSNFTSDCIVTREGVMAVRLLYRGAMVDIHNAAGIVVGELSFGGGGVQGDGRPLPLPVVI